MRLMRLGVLAGSLAALSALALTGCGVVDRDVEPLPKARKKGGPKADDGGAAKLDPVGKADDYVGVIKGKVVWEGPTPDFKALTAAFQDKMASSQDRGYCLDDSAAEIEKSQQEMRIGDNKGLGNVFVWIAPPAGQYLVVPDKNMPKDQQVVISQPHCAFLPHCETVFASRYKDGKQDAKGCQKLVVVNDALKAHNANVVGGPLNGSTNKGIPAWDGKGAYSRETFALRPETNEIKINCNVHAWMSAVVRVYDHPYHTLSSVGRDKTDAKKVVWDDPTSKDYGTFTITGAPVGATVTLFAWHEKLGHLLGPAGKQITVEKDAAKNEQTITAK